MELASQRSCIRTRFFFVFIRHQRFRSRIGKLVGPLLRQIDKDALIHIADVNRLTRYRVGDPGR